MLSARYMSSVFESSDYFMSFKLMKQERRKVSESAPAMAYMRARADMGDLGTTSKSRPVMAEVADRAPPPM
jgi:hypothetical protein